jgi:hypothetical protein
VVVVAIADVLAVMAKMKAAAQILILAVSNCF